jgi:hypothetical protein
MATTTNYGWTTPDDTSLVKDGAAAIRTLGSSVDTTTKALNPSTTLGDIEYRSSTANTNTRLGIGTTGQVLSVSGGVPAWTTPAGVSATSYALLNAGGTALTGATTITVSSLSGYNKFLVSVVGASASASSEISFRLNGSSLNYSDQQNYIGVQSTYTVSDFGVSQETTKITLAFLSSNAASVARGYLQIDGCNSTGVKTFTHAGGASASGGNGQFHVWGGGTWTDSAVVSSISIVSGTGNFDAGTIFIYGAN